MNENTTRTHTRGPWFHRPTNHPDLSTVSQTIETRLSHWDPTLPNEDGSYGAWTHPVDGNIDDYERVAITMDARNSVENARLIAAAPDMLDALRMIAACVADEDGGVTLGTYEQGRVWAAIRLATQGRRQTR